jgi:hemoglobin/transferrin/lactoferrin receptor protein
MKLEKMIRKLVHTVILASALSALTAPAFAQSSNTSPAGSAEVTSKSEDLRRQGEGLIYSVDRTPERTFETARAVEVITAEEIWRKNATSLSDILSETPGFIKYRTTQSSTSPIIRGLLGRQILLLIDGVKVNDAIFGDTPNLDLIDVSQIERIEIVRGVVSVLGTESLGGVINVITRRGSSDKNGIGGSIGARYSSAAGALSTPVSVHGQSEKFRWILGADYQKFGDSKGGSGVGTQRFTNFIQRSANLGFDYFVSPEKTLSASYHASAQSDVMSPTSMISGVSVMTKTTPVRLQLGSLSYQDLTDRGWAQSLRVTAYSNIQDSGTTDVRVKTPTLQSLFKERDRLMGLNLELGTFLGAHHIAYGTDLTRDTVSSFGQDINETTGITTWKRGRFTNGGQYETAGIYGQDQFDVTKWATITAGLRYGTFKASGSEVLPVIGSVNLDSKKSGVTSTLSAVVHVAPQLNLIGNMVRGFRAPNLRDISRFSLGTTSVEIPNPEVAAEKVTSYEGGVKYDGTFLSGSAFYFRNQFSNLLVVAAGSFNGLTFLDVNGNGRRDATEPSVSRNQNIGSANIHGYEVELKVTPTPELSILGNYTSSTASSRDTLQASLVSRVPPPYGAATVRYNLRAEHSPWAEFVYSFTKDFSAGGVVLSPKFNEYAIRTGFSVTDRWRLSVSGENLGDQRYVARFVAIAYPGRRFVVGSEYRF